MTPEELKERLTQFGIDVVNLCVDLRAVPGGRNVADQLSDSATSIGSNYRVCCRARSKKEFISKLSIAVEEAEETVGWLETVTRSRLNPGEKGTRLLQEAREILAVLAASRRTAEGRNK